MNKEKLLLFFSLLCFFITSCSDVHTTRSEHFQRWIQNNGKVKVLSTTAMINDLVEKVGGERVDGLVLIQGELDPHSYQLVKGDDEKMRFAHVIFANGLGLEHGPSLERYLAQHTKTVRLGDLLYQQEPSVILELKGQKDPHIWMDISLWAKTVPFIVQTLSQADPMHASEFEGRGSQLIQEMMVAHQDVKQALQQIPAKERYLVTSHDAFSYFTRAYLAEEGEVETGEWQKRFAAPEGLAPESQLSTTDIKNIIDYLYQHQIHVLFPESNVNRDSLKKIIQAGKEKGLQIKMACCPLYGDAMGNPGSEGDTYLKMIAFDAKMIADHLNDKNN